MIGWTGPTLEVRVDGRLYEVGYEVPPGPEWGGLDRIMFVFEKDDPERPVEDDEYARVRRAFESHRAYEKGERRRG